MYENFTRPARKVMVWANCDADRFNHEYIGTEHVLLALLREASCTAVNVLKDLDLDLRKIRLEVELVLRTGPETVATGKKPHTPSVVKVIDYAIKESEKVNRDYVGTEHLLLGLLRVKEGTAGQVLANLGVTLNDVYETIHETVVAPEPRRLRNSFLPNDAVRFAEYPVIKPLLQKLEQFQLDKEVAIVLMDFEHAARLRDQQHKTHAQLRRVLDRLSEGQ